MNYAMINSATNIVEGCIECDAPLPWSPPEQGYYIDPAYYVQDTGDSGAQIGWSYINGQFVPPASNG
jgi:hypothetical protein